MTSHNRTDISHRNISRRKFVQRSGALATGLLVGSRDVHGQNPAETPSSTPASGKWPQRILGRTKVPVTTMTLGTAPCGLTSKIPPPEIAKIVNYALDQGITSVDTAPAYKQAEEGVGLALGSRRKDIFLATKVMADSIDKAEESLSKSFELLRTDWIDLVYFHSAGDRDIEKGMSDNGVFSWLIKQKQAGKFRFLGISGHNRPQKFIPLLETDEVDVLLTVVNFVDQHTYGFETKVLPVARKHNTGIVAMKVFGGARKSAGSYENPKAPPEMDVKYLEQAVRYSLGTPGVATLNLGVHNQDQVRQNIELVKNFKPLLPGEQTQLSDLGKTIAGQWGTHFGPVADV